MTRAPVILAATDGTERSQAVLGRAALIARDWGARLALVHVRKAGAARFRLRLARTSRHELAQELAAHGGDAAALHMLEGAPAERIAALVEQLQPALLVMGLHRERRVLDVLRMTTMERITLAVTCPVLLPRSASTRSAPAAWRWRPASHRTPDFTPFMPCPCRCPTRRRGATKHGARQNSCGTASCPAPACRRI